MRNTIIPIGMSVAAMVVTLGCSRYEPTPVPVVPVSVDPVQTATDVQLVEARQAADVAREQARAATEARVQAERAAASIEARVVAAAAGTPTATRTGPSVIGYGPSDAIDRAEAGTYGSAGVVGVGGTLEGETLSARRTTVAPGSGTTGSGTGAAPQVGLGSPGFPTASPNSTGAPTLQRGSTNRTDDLQRLTDRNTPLVPDGGSFDGGTRRDGGFADGGQRRPLQPSTTPTQPQSQTQPSQLIQPNAAPQPQPSTPTTTQPSQQTQSPGGTIR